MNGTARSLIHLESCEGGKGTRWRAEGGMSLLESFDIQFYSTIKSALHFGVSFSFRRADARRFIAA